MTEVWRHDCTSAEQWNITFAGTQSSPKTELASRAQECNSPTVSAFSSTFSPDTGARQYFSGSESVYCVYCMFLHCHHNAISCHAVHAVASVLSASNGSIVMLCARTCGRATIVVVVVSVAIGLRDIRRSYRLCSQLLCCSFVRTLHH